MLSTLQSTSPSSCSTFLIFWGIFQFLAFFFDTVSTCSTPKPPSHKSLILSSLLGFPPFIQWLCYSYILHLRLTNSFHLYSLVKYFLHKILEITLQTQMLYHTSSQGSTQTHYLLLIIEILGLYIMIVFLLFSSLTNITFFADSQAVDVQMATTVL